MNEPIIIHTGYGGLGDNLMFSTLPRAFHDHGHEEIYISLDNPYHNQEIKKLVWDQNPYILGESDEKPNAGFVHTGNPYIPHHDNFIRSIEIANGVDNRSELPEVYVDDLPYMTDFSDKAIVDLTAITRGNDYPDNLQEIVAKDLFEFFALEDILFVEFENVESRNYLRGHGDYRFVTIKDIFQYCSLIKSCNTYVSLHSGGNMLAVAIADEVICYIPEWVYNMYKKNGNQALFPDHCEYRLT